MAKDKRPKPVKTNQTGLDEYLKSLGNTTETDVIDSPEQTETALPDTNYIFQDKLLRTGGPKSTDKKFPEQEKDTFESLIKPVTTEPSTTKTKQLPREQFQREKQDYVSTEEESLINQLSETADVIQTQMKGIDLKNKDQVNEVNKYIELYQNTLARLQKVNPIWTLPPEIIEYQYKNVPMLPKQMEQTLDVFDPEKMVTRPGVPFAVRQGDLPQEDLDDKKRAFNYATLVKSMDRNIPVQDAIKLSDLRGTPVGRLMGSLIQGMGSIPEGFSGMGEMLADETGIEPLKDYFVNQGKLLSEQIETVAPPDPNIAEQFTSGLGSFIAFTIPGMTVASAGKLAGMAPKLAKWLGVGVSTIMEAGTEAGLVYKESKNTEAATKTFLANLLLVGLTNRYGIYADQLPALKRIIMSRPLEGIQEFFQEVISDGSQGKPINWENAITAGGIGLALSESLGFVQGGQKTTEQEEETVPEKFEDIIPTQTPSQTPGELSGTRGLIQKIADTLNNTEVQKLEDQRVDFSEDVSRGKVYLRDKSIKDDKGGVPVYSIPIEHFTPEKVMSTINMGRKKFEKATEPTEAAEENIPGTAQVKEAEPEKVEAAEIPAETEPVEKIEEPDYKKIFEESGIEGDYKGINKGKGGVPQSITLDIIVDAENENPALRKSSLTIPINKFNAETVQTESEKKIKEFQEVRKPKEVKIKTAEDLQKASTIEVRNFVKDKIGNEEFTKLMEDAVKNDTSPPIEGKTVEEMQGYAIDAAVHAKAIELVEGKKSEVRSQKEKVEIKLAKDVDERIKWIAENYPDKQTRFRANRLKEGYSDEFIDAALREYPELRKNKEVLAKGFKSILDVPLAEEVDKNSLADFKENFGFYFEGNTSKNYFKGTADEFYNQVKDAQKLSKTEKVKPDQVQQLKQKIYDNLQYLNDKKMPGSQRTKAKNEAKLQVNELIKAGVAAQLKLSNSKWDLFIDNVKQNKRTLGLVEKVEKVDLTEIKYKNEVSKPFKELELEIRDRQEIIAENFVEPEDLPSGSGQAVLNQGLDDIKKNDGKEITPAAMAVRDAAEIIFNNGKRVIAMAHYPKQELQPEDIWIFIDEKIEEKAIQQLNAEEEASEKERISAEAVIKEADDLEKRIDSTDPEERNKAIGEIDQAAENLFGEAEKLGYKKKSVFAEQTSFAELAKAKVPEKGITGEGKSEEITPLFQQKAEDKAQGKMFEEKKPAEPVAEQEDVGKKKLLTSLIDITKLKKDKLTTEDIDKVSDIYNQSKDLFTSDQLTEITGFIDKLKEELTINEKKRELANVFSKLKVPDEFYNELNIRKEEVEWTKAVTTKGSDVILEKSPEYKDHPDLKEGTLATVLRPRKAEDITKPEMVVIEYKDSKGKTISIAVKDSYLAPVKPEVKKNLQKEKPKKDVVEKKLYTYLQETENYDINELAAKTGQPAKDIANSLNDLAKRKLVNRVPGGFEPTDEFKILLDDINKNPEKYEDDFGLLYSNPLPAMIKGVSKMITAIDDIYKRYVGDKVYKAAGSIISKITPEKVKQLIVTNYGLPTEYIAARREAHDALQRYKELAKEIGDNLLYRNLVTGEKFTEAEQQRLSQVIKGSVTMNPLIKERTEQAINEIKQLEIIGKELEVLPVETYNTKLPRKRIQELLKEKAELEKKRNKIIRSLKFEKDLVLSPELADELNATQKKALSRATKNIDLKIQDIHTKIKNSYVHGGEGYLKRVYLSKEQIKTLAKYGYTRPTRLDLTSAMHRKDIPYEIRKEMGEILTAAYPAAKGIMLEGKDVSFGRFFEVISENPDWSSETEVSGWVKMPKDEKLGKVSELYVEPRIAADINDVMKFTSDEEMDKFLKRVNATWKATKTIMNPSTHLRNIYSNSIMLDFSGVAHTDQLRILPEAIKAIKGTGKYAAQFKASRLNNTTFTTQELGQYLDLAAEDRGFMDLSIPDKLLKIYGKATLVDTKVGQFLGKVYQMEEVLGKAVKFISEVEKGKSIIEARQESNKWMFDYSEIPSLVRKLRTNPIFGIPFITWSYKAFPRIIETAITRPLTFWKYPVIFSAITQYALKSLGIDDDDWEKIKADLPERMIKGEWLLLPFRDAKNKMQMLDLTYILPYKDVYDVIESGFSLATSGRLNNADDIVDGILGLIQAPILKSTAEMLTNKDTYTNQQIWFDIDGPAEKTQKAFDHLYKTFMPSLAPEIPFLSQGGYSYHKLRSVLSDRDDYYGRTFSLGPAVTSVMLGLKTSPIEPEKNIERKEAKLQNQLIQLATKENQILRDGSLSEEQRLVKAMELEKQKDDLRRELAGLEIPVKNEEIAQTEKQIRSLQAKYNKVDLANTKLRESYATEINKMKIKLNELLSNPDAYTGEKKKREEEEKRKKQFKKSTIKSFQKEL